LFHKPEEKVGLSKAFYLALWGQIGLGLIIYFSGFKEPRFLLTLSAVLNGGAMMVAFPLIFWLNNKSLPAKIQPGRFRKGMLLAAFCLFLGVRGLTLGNALGFKL
jgi:hypothetical protein